MVDVTVTAEDGTQVVGFVAVVEVVTEAGERKLVRVGNDASEGWQRAGYLHAALHGELGP